MLSGLVSKNVRSESHVLCKIWLFCLIVYVSLSIAIQEESSLIQRFKDGKKTFFQCLAIRRFAYNGQRLTNLLSWILRAYASGISPRIQESLWMMLEIVQIIPFQNSCTCLHFQMQWNRSFLCSTLFNCMGYEDLIYWVSQELHLVYFLCFVSGAHG